MTFLREHRSAIAYVVLSLACIVNFGLVQRQADRSEERQAEQLRINEGQLVAVCESNADVRRAIRDLVGPEPQAFPTPPGADEALANAIQEANRRSAESWTRVQQVFSDPPCKATLPDSPAPGTTTTK